MSADTETTPLINSERTIKENEEIQESQSAENVKEEQFSFSKTTSRERWLLVSMAPTEDRILHVPTISIFILYIINYVNTILSDFSADFNLLYLIVR
jgi:hypothetical protein